MDVLLPPAHAPSPFARPLHFALTLAAQGQILSSPVTPTPSHYHHSDGISSALRGQRYGLALNMLSRAGSDASAHLRRTKSAASVKQRRIEQLTQDSVNPNTARIHAVTAAHIAMGRATQRTSIEMRRSADLAKCDGNTNKPSNHPTARSQTLLLSPASELRRQRSILQSKGPSVVSSCHDSNDHFGADLPHYAAPPLSELGIMDRHGSEPSSYRKLRQVKSVITPRKRAMNIYNTSSCSPSSARIVQNVNTSLGEAERGLKLGLKRSMSFLRDNSSNLPKPFKQGENTRQRDEAIRLAQEQFRNDLEQQRLRKKTSFFSLPKTRPPHKAFRKTVRSSRTTEFGDGVKSQNQASHSSQPVTKSRSISASFRDKVKRIFGRSISNKDKFPAQQLDASRPYFRDYTDGSGIESALDRYFVDDNDATARGSLYIPSSHECDSLEDQDRMSSTMRSAQSMESLHSNNRSRVTSWTNSTITNSISARGAPLDLKRLSIIKEDGGSHQPSSPISRHVSGIEVFRKPLPTRNGYGQPAQPVDGRRLYSALMKRVDQEQADAESSQEPGAPASQKENFPPSSTESSQTPPTVRAVPNDASLCTVAPDSEHRQFSIGTTYWHEGSGMTPQELAQHNENLERIRAQPAQQEEQSSFFPFSKQGKLQTPSSFKLALTARKENSGTSQSDSDSVVVTHPTNSQDQVHGKFALSSESIYSRTTGGHTIPHDLSGHNSPEDADESPSVGGMATIPTKVARYPRPTPSLVQLHRARSTERGEWKGWMENQMISLGRRHSRATTSHHREHAQIDGDDTAVRSGGESPTKSTGFATELSRHGSQRTIRKAKDGSVTPVPLQRKSSIMNERFSLLNLKELPHDSMPSPTASDSQRPSMVRLNDENRNAGGGDMQRRSSVRLRKNRSQLVFNYGNIEENLQPVSTLGHPRRSINEDGKAASFASLKELTPTPKQRPKSQMSVSNWAQFGKNITNDLDRNLARLSTPFDVDILDGNRPFDSEYLGTDQSYGIGGKADRLSVASTGTPGYYGDDEGGDTALPKIEGNDTNNKNRTIISSKRMVSNFLRSRKKNAPAQGQMDGEKSGSSPAFV